MKKRILKHAACAITSMAIMPAFATQTQTQPMPWPQIHRPQATTGSTKEAANTLVQAGNSYTQSLFNEIFNATDRPEWLKRTDITYSVQQKNTPVGSVETIQPIYFDCKNTLFWQGRAAYNDGSATYNLGLGYRYLRDKKDLMWGINSFFDENPRLQHKRLGLGGELFTPYVTLRANYYDALSGRLYVGSNTYERALNGFDASVETPVPYFAWVRFTAQGYHWEGVKSTNVNGGLAQLRIFPARQLEIDAGAAYDNSQQLQTFLKLDYYLGAADFIEYSATTPYPSTPYAAQNLENMRLQKVIRHNDIVVEKTASSPSTSAVIIARGT